MFVKGILIIFKILIIILIGNIIIKILKEIISAIKSNLIKKSKVKITPIIKTDLIAVTEYNSNNNKFELKYIGYNCV